MKRLAGVLTSLFLLHLTLAGADLTCATHGVHRASRASGPKIASHEHHHAPAPTQRSDHRHTSCAVPTLPACCEALASCTVSLAESSSEDSSEVSLLAAGVRAADADAPASWSLEPDSPPPKA